MEDSRKHSGLGIPLFPLCSQILESGVNLSPYPGLLCTAPGPLSHMGCRPGLWEQILVSEALLSSSVPAHNALEPQGEGKPPENCEAAGWLSLVLTPTALFTPDKT